LRVVSTSVISFQLIDRMEVCSSTDEAIKDIVVYLSGGIVADGQDSAIEKDVLVKVGAGEEDGRIDMPAKGFRRPILVNLGRDYNRAGLGGIVGEVAGSFDEALVTVAVADTHVELQR
jgi:hypothetical protein